MTIPEIPSSAWGILFMALVSGATYVGKRICDASERILNNWIAMQQKAGEAALEERKAAIQASAAERRDQAAQVTEQRNALLGMMGQQASLLTKVEEGLRDLADVIKEHGETIRVNQRQGEEIKALMNRLLGNRESLERLGAALQGPDG